MKSGKIHLTLAVALALLLVPTVHAQQVNWQFGGENNLWSNSGNWVGGVVPNSNTTDAAFVGAANVAIDVDSDHTIRSYLDAFGGQGFTHTLFGAGTLTIDRNTNAPIGNVNARGITNATGKPPEAPEDLGGTLRFNGFLTINNTDPSLVPTAILNTNSPHNILLFDTGCQLKLLTRLQTLNGIGGTINFNCELVAGSTANLQFNSNNVFFGDGHLSTEFGNDLVFLANSRLTINGGTVLNTDRKFQVNGTGARLVLNAPNTMNNPNVVVGASHNFTIEVNANQETPGFGYISIAEGTLTIDVDPLVSKLFFGKSAEVAWGSGSIEIVGFKENTIRFGTDNTGLSAEQLEVIDGGIYTLTPNGYLTAMPAGSNYESWASANGISGQPFDGDFNGDGISNGIAYALGLSPTESSHPTGVLSGNTITFTKGADAIANADVSWVIQVSQTLEAESWTDEVTQAAGNATAIISYDLDPASGTPRKFARLKVVQVP